jgi:hypothetical protein
LRIGPDAIACGLLAVGAAPLLFIASIMGHASGDFWVIEITTGKTSEGPLI